MLSIDEAIQRENKIVEENQKIVDTEIVFDGVSLSQLYCDDIEVIEEHLENYKKCTEYHKQIAEWLEELKELRLESSLSKTNETIASHVGYEVGYNKAIDNFSKLIKQRKFDYIEQDLEFDEFVDIIAEQLKEGE